MATGTLISLGGNLETPRDSKPSDYPAVGPSGGAGESSGAGKLVTQTTNQMGACHTQDSGPGTPSRWTVEGFEVSVNKGEGGTASTSITIPEGVDLSTGLVSPNVATSHK